MLSSRGDTQPVFPSHFIKQQIDLVRALGEKLNPEAKGDGLLVAPERINSIIRSMEQLQVTITKPYTISSLDNTLEPYTGLIDKIDRGIKKLQSNSELVAILRQIRNNIIKYVDTNYPNATQGKPISKKYHEKSSAISDYTTQTKKNITRSSCWQITKFLCKSAAMLTGPAMCYTITGGFAGGVISSPITGFAILGEWNSIFANVFCEKVKAFPPDFNCTLGNGEISANFTTVAMGCSKTTWDCPLNSDPDQIFEDGRGKADHAANVVADDWLDGNAGYWIGWGVLYGASVGAGLGLFKFIRDNKRYYNPDQVMQEVVDGVELSKADQYHPGDFYRPLEEGRLASAPPLGKVSFTS